MGTGWTNGDSRKGSQTEMVCYIDYLSHGKYGAWYLARAMIPPPDCIAETMGGDLETLLEVAHKRGYTGETLVLAPAVDEILKVMV